MKFNVFVNKEAVLFIGGNPDKGKMPIISMDLTNPQILVDAESGRIIITETVGKPKQTTKKGVKYSGNMD